MSAVQIGRPAVAAFTEDVTTTTDAGFLALVLADDQLLQAEFDAIVRSPPA